MEPKIQRKRQRNASPSLLQVSLSVNLIFVLGLIYLSLVGNSSNSDVEQNHVIETATIWHGGNPAEDKSGSCWCGEDKYCMCTPNLAIDLVITSGGGGSHERSDAEFFWLVRRKDTNQLATMGGFVDVHETIENAVKRELMEEMALTLNETPTLVGLYSDPRRDNRRRTASAVFAVHLSGDIRPRAGDDAKEVVKIPINEVEKHSYFSDHQTILLDYRSILRGDVVELDRAGGDFTEYIHRSTCGSFNS